MCMKHHETMVFTVKYKGLPLNCPVYQSNDRETASTLIISCRRIRVNQCPSTSNNTATKTLRNTEKYSNVHQKDIETWKKTNKHLNHLVQSTMIIKIGSPIWKVADTRKMFPQLPLAPGGARRGPDARLPPREAASCPPCHHRGPGASWDPKIPGSQWDTLGEFHRWLLKELVDLPSKNYIVRAIFHGYGSLPEGTTWLKKCWKDWLPNPMAYQNPQSKKGVSRPKNLSYVVLSG